MRKIAKLRRGSFFLLGSFMLSGFVQSAVGSVAQQNPSPGENLLPGSPQASEAEFAEARRLLQQGKFDEAVTLLHALSLAHPSAKGLAHELGAAYYRKGEYVNAIASLKKAVDENPSDSEATHLLGLSYYLAGRP